MATQNNLTVNRQRSGSYGILSYWPNKYTLLNAAPILANLSCEVFNKSLSFTLSCNLPLSTLRFSYNAWHKNYYKAAFGLTSFAVLLLPHGRIVSVGLNLAEEFYNFYRYYSRVQGTSFPSCIKRLKVDCVQNACKILNMPEDRAKDLDFVKARWEKITQELNRRKQNLSRPLAAEFELMLEDCNSAYTFLQKDSIK